MTKTFTAKPQETERKWVLVDLDNMVLGRAASKIAMLLRGKNSATYTPHIDTGNFVVAINAAKVRLTGTKLDSKFYHKHSGYPGGLKSTSAREFLAKHPEQLVIETVWGMLPKNTLSQHQLKKLKVYAGSDHPHGSQLPKVIKL